MEDGLDTETARSDELVRPGPIHRVSHLDFTTNHCRVRSLNCAAGTKLLDEAHQVCLVFARYTHTAVKFPRNDGKGHYAGYLYRPDLETTGARIRSQSDIDISIERGSEPRAIHLRMETRNHLDLLESSAENPDRPTRRVGSCALINQRRP